MSFVCYLLWLHINYYDVLVIEDNLWHIAYCQYTVAIIFPAICSRLDTVLLCLLLCHLILWLFSFSIILIMFNLYTLSSWLERRLCLVGDIFSCSSINSGYFYIITNSLTLYCCSCSCIDKIINVKIKLRSRITYLVFYRIQQTEYSPELKHYISN